MNHEGHEEHEGPSLGMRLHSPLSPEADRVVTGAVRGRAQSSSLKREIFVNFVSFVVAGS